MIIVDRLSKKYRVNGKESVVLQDLSFRVESGQKLALIGKNGAGKSTLIRLLGKVELPSSGSIKYKMRVSWPLGFTGAFQGSLSGLDNLKFLSRIYRVDYLRMRKFVDDFTELGEHLYKPVKFYSSGMRARLAFALSLSIDFDCYLIDEVVLVGDHRFHKRCEDLLFNTNKSKSLIIASHDMGFLANTCDSAAIVSNGGIELHKNVTAAIENYMKQ